MKQVKGSFFKVVVKAIKSNKSGVYDTILSDKAKDILNQRILDSIWYPFEVYKETYDAVCKVEARNNPKIIIEWGKRFGEELMKTIYKNTLVDSDIEKIMNSFKRFHSMVLNWGEFKAEIKSDNQVDITYENFERDWELFYYIIIGWILRFTELCINKKVNFKILEKSWEGAKDTKFTLFWSS